MLLCAFLAPILAAEMLMVYSRYQDHREQEIAANLEQARAAATRFEVYVRDLLRQEQSIGLALLAPGRVAGEQANHLLAASAGEQSSLHSYSLADPQGRILAHSHPEFIGQEIGDRPYFQELLSGREWAVSDLLVGRASGEASFVVARGMRSASGELQGVVIATVLPDRLLDVLHLKRSEPGSLSIIDRQGQLVYRYPQLPPGWEQRQPLESSLLRQALDGSEASGSIVSNPAQQAEVVGFAPIAFIGWAAEAGRPAPAALAPIIRALPGQAGLFLLVAIVAFLVVAAISKALVVPLRRLAQHAAALGEGELDQQAASEGPREMRELAAAFNGMARQIRLREEERSRLLASEQAARSQAEAAQQQVAFLAAASTMLASSLDYESTLSNVTALVVPELADWCMIHLLDQDGASRQLALAYPDTARLELGRELLQRYPIEAQLEASISSVLRCAGGACYFSFSDELLQAIAHDSAHLQLLRQLNLTSAMLVPLAARGRTLGAISLISAESGRVYGPADVALAEDLAHRCALAVDNARLYREAHEAIQLRDQFLSLAAHELRTPIAALLSYAELFERRIQRSVSLPERESGNLRSLVTQAARLNKMVDMLLNIPHLQTGQFTIERAPVDLHTLVRRVTDELQPLLERHKLALSSDATPLIVCGDELRLEQVMQNLIGNAIKYSPAGGLISVYIGHRNEQAYVEISDQGIGIPPDALSRIFERYYRADNAGQQQIRGMGLGLFVVKEIVALHGGMTNVASQVGAGSTFSIHLPLSQPKQRDPAPASGNPRGSSPETARREAS